MNTIFAILVLLSLLSRVPARPKYPALIPNGNASKIPNSGIDCAHLGHKNCIVPKQNESAINNKFGLDFKAAGYNWTKAFCTQDSDNDGLTNGEELGDPCCEWSTTNKTQLRTTNLSNPADASKKAVGNVTCARSKVSPTPTSSPSKVTKPSPAASQKGTSTPTTNSTSVCFPGDAHVALDNGSIVRMASLEIGDHAEVAAGVYSPVFMFTHKIADIRSEFVSIRTRRGANLHLSTGHFLYVDSKLAPAVDVRVGHHVEVDGKPDDVVAVDRIVKKGLYNPQTIHGDIVVDRVRVATFTRAFHYGASQAALSPFRAAYRSFGVNFQAFERGVICAFVPCL